VIEVFMFEKCSFLFTAVSIQIILYAGYVCCFMILSSLVSSWAPGNTRERPVRATWGQKEWGSKTKLLFHQKLGMWCISFLCIRFWQIVW